MFHLAIPKQHGLLSPTVVDTDNSTIVYPFKTKSSQKASEMIQFLVLDEAGVVFDAGVVKMNLDTGRLSLEHYDTDAVNAVKPGGGDGGRT